MVRDEPLPPEGISMSALYRSVVAAFGEEKAVGFWRWLTVEYPGWSRENANRLIDLRSLCPP